MLQKRPIRIKFLVGLGLLILMVGILSTGGLYTMYAYRTLVKNLSWRVVELPVAAEMSRQVGELRIILSELRGLKVVSFPPTETDPLPLRAWMIRDQFHTKLDQVEDTLSDYRAMVEHPLRDDFRIADKQHERKTVHKIELALERVHAANRDEAWVLDDLKVGQLDMELRELQLLTTELPSYLHTKLAGFSDEVRGRRRMLIVGTWIVIALAGMMFALFVQLFYRWIVQPLQVLIHGSRQVASGRFNYQLKLNTGDEMAELAGAMNDMTARFRDIRDDLDEQVRQRTKQVIRSEQLASVGFLAAGVAHEINNPLASIAMCAESLQTRVGQFLQRDNPEHEVVEHYLQMVQDEAFRCKEITEKLLDFSRIGQTERTRTDLVELVQGVVDMVGHLGRYQDRKMEFASSRPLLADINGPEIKQVVLNLLTNALDSVQTGGTVRIEVRARGEMAELVFCDNGCGIAPEVIEHIFEPFFTRRREGQGTGLGLSISYRIVADHGGEITAESDGADRGATFRIRLPCEASMDLRRHDAPDRLSPPHTTVAANIS